MNAMTRIDRRGSATVTTPSDTEILITRVFDAPAELIFRAFTTPELVKRWWGFESSNWLVCEIDLRVGGKWRYVTSEANGMEVGFHGEYREIARPHRLVSTEAYEGMLDADANAAVNTVTLEEADGVTTMRVLVRHVNQWGRDMHLNSGMERGMQVSYDRLEAVAQQLATPR